MGHGDYTAYPPFCPAPAGPCGSSHVTLRAEKADRTCQALRTKQHLPDLLEDLFPPLQASLLTQFLPARPPASGPGWGGVCGGQSSLHFIPSLHFHPEGQSQVPGSSFPHSRISWVLPGILLLPPFPVPCCHVNWEWFLKAGRQQVPLLSSGRARRKIWGTTGWAASPQLILN